MNSHISDTKVPDLHSRTQSGGLDLLGAKESETNLATELAH